MTNIRSDYDGDDGDANYDYDQDYECCVHLANFT